MLWSTPEFGFVEFDDAFSTGSSIMPQKKNPDIAELIRGKTGRVIGSLVGLLTVMKGLPLAYNSDMQEDKEQFFDALDTTVQSVDILNQALKTIQFRPERMASAVHGDFSTATDLADCLARKGLPFREAHHLVGRIVRDCIEGGRTLEDLSAEDFQQYDPRIEADIMEALTPEASLRSHASEGGTAPQSVQRQLDRARQVLES